MSESFDPYLKWLGIRDAEHPPNHYRLLGLEPFESDPEVIDAAADRQMAHVRTFQSGPYADLSQTLLNQLAVARRCLLNDESRADYDSQLRRASPDIPPKIRTYYEILGISPDADESTIRQGFRRSVQAHHPDRNPDSRRSAKRIRHLNAARDTLLNPELRQQYDAKLRREGHISGEDPLDLEELLEDIEAAPETVGPSSGGFYAHDFRSAPEPDAPPWQTPGQTFRPPTATWRRKKRGNHWAKTLILWVTIPSGGIAGVAVSILLLWIAFGQDPFGLFQPEGPGPAVAEIPTKIDSSEPGGSDSAPSKRPTPLSGEPPRQGAPPASNEADATGTKEPTVPWDEPDEPNNNTPTVPRDNPTEPNAPIKEPTVPWNKPKEPTPRAKESKEPTEPTVTRNNPTEPSVETFSLLQDDTLDHFTGYNNEKVGAGWKCQDGILTFDGSGGGHIVTKESFGDFELTFDWKIADGANSGVMYRVSMGDEHPHLSGPEYQILDDANHSNGQNELTSAGSLYGLYKPVGKQLKPVGQWNTAKIVLQRNHLEHWLNGKKVVDVELNSDDWNERVADSKFAKWQKFGKNRTGRICFQDHGDEVAFRNIQVTRPTEPTVGRNKPHPSTFNTGLVAYYPFNGNAQDASGNDHHGTVKGPTLTKDRFGRIDQSYQVKNNYIDLPPSVTLDYPKLTMSAWVFLDGPTQAKYARIVGGHFYLDPLRNNFLGINNENGKLNLELEIDTDFTTRPNLNSATDQQTLPTNQWHHLALVYDGRNLAGYINGKRRIRKAASGKLKPMTDVRIGGGLNEKKNSGIFGKLDDVRIYKRALSEVEIRALYDYESKHPSTHSPPKAIAPFDATTAIAPFDAATAKSHQQAWAEHMGLPVEFENSIGMTMRLVPPGQFMMGEGTQRTVTLTRPFYLGCYEVRQREYRSVRKKNPSHHVDPEKPLEQVTWEEANDFCQKMSQLPEERKLNHVYRLPTEAEWEHACRAGTATDYFFGDDPDAVSDFAWGRTNSLGETHAVGLKGANPWGFHDMLGNVTEWCSDWQGDLPTGAVTDPIGPTSGSTRVLRGGSYTSGVERLRAGARPFPPPEAPEGYRDRGFRVVLLIPDEYFNPAAAKENRQQAAATSPSGRDFTGSNAKEALKKQARIVGHWNYANFAGTFAAELKVSADGTVIWKDLTNNLTLSKYWSRSDDGAFLISDKRGVRGQKGWSVIHFRPVGEFAVCDSWAAGEKVAALWPAAPAGSASKNGDDPIVGHWLYQPKKGNFFAQVDARADGTVYWIGKNGVTMTKQWALFDKDTYLISDKSGVKGNAGWHLVRFPARNGVLFCDDWNAGPSSFTLRRVKRR